jgi:hypothetical protein
LKVAPLLYQNGRRLMPSKFDAIEEFFHSEDYQKVKPLREGSGVYNIATYEAAP